MTLRRSRGWLFHSRAALPARKRSDVLKGTGGNMCGIVGYIGNREVSGVLLDSLKRLEYRGYDSCGVAIIDEGHPKIIRSVGRIGTLEEKIRQTNPTNGSVKCGIGHTRWATHGRPSEINSHPHRDCTGRFYVAHNGIIENYLYLKHRLMAEGHIFATKTDTEVLPHLIEAYYDGDLEGAVRRALEDVEGVYGIAVVSSEGDGRQIVAARNGPPLVVGIGSGENFVASDVPALLPYTRSVVFLEDGQIAVVSSDSVQIKNSQGECMCQPAETINWTAEMAEKEGYAHFMLKEIHEQPRAIRDTLRGRIGADDTVTIGRELGKADFLAGVERLEIGVASTKAFITQLTSLYLLALELAQLRRTLPQHEIRRYVRQLRDVPDQIKNILDRNQSIAQLAERFWRYSDFLYLGRGINCPIAMEGALKLKEISYIHAEGYAAGEMKHGPIALIDTEMPVVVLAPQDAVYRKTMGNVEEVKVRDGIVIAVATEGDREIGQKADHTVYIPEADPLVNPMLSTIPLQLFAYHIAVLRGCDVDKPRNLAKSVTVE